MTTTSILIIDYTGDCRLAAAKALMPEGFSVMAATDSQKAAEMMAAGRPSLIVADCGPDNDDPLIWVNMVHQLGLAAQVIAVTDRPDFDRAMDWVAGGIYNVLTRPIDEERLRRISLAAIENCETFSLLTTLPETPVVLESENTSQTLKDFYHGLTGRLDSVELKQYIIDSVKKLTGARQVELCLVEDVKGSTYCLETHTFISDVGLADFGGFSHAYGDVARSTKSRLGFELICGDQHLGEIYLYFENKADLKIRSRETMNELVAACSSALASAVRFKKASILAARDGLTGLYNRRIFNEFLKREFAKAERHNFNLSLLSLDLDHFKSVNDNFGHQTGDMVLKTVAKVIARVARATDLPARLGGEEFAIILPHTNQEQAIILARRIQDILSETDFNLGGDVFHQTVSQGVGGLEHFMVKSPEDMVYWADQALYLAKREGRDTIRTASDLPMTPAMKDGPYAFQ